MKYIIRLLSACAISIFFLCNTTFANEQTPESLVKDFYTWYTAENAKNDEAPEENDTIFNYVNACTVKKIRIDNKKGIVTYNYFYQSNGFDADKDAIFVTPSATKVSEIVSVVPVGYRDKNWEKSPKKNVPPPHLLVYVQNEEGKLRIIKVEEFSDEY